MEKVKLAKLVQAEPALKEFIYEKLPVDYANEYMNFCSLCFEKLREFKNKNNELVTTKYGIQTENGWEINPDMKVDFESEVKPMLEEDLEMEVPHLSIAKIKESNPEFAISTITLTHLKNFILYE